MKYFRKFYISFISKNLNHSVINTCLIYFFVNFSLHLLLFLDETF